MFTLQFKYLRQHTHQRWIVVEKLFKSLKTPRCQKCRKFQDYFHNREYHSEQEFGFSEPFPYRCENTLLIVETAL